jgi:hypothetical protein
MRATTTVLLADLPPLLEDMMSSLLEGHFTINMARGIDRDFNLINAAAEAGAPVVVVARRNPSDLTSIDSYLANAVNVSVVAVALDGTSACLHAFNAAGCELADVSAEQLFMAIAGAATLRKQRQ